MTKPIHRPAPPVTITAEDVDRLTLAVGALLGLLTDLRMRQEDAEPPALPPVLVTEPAPVVELAAWRRRKH